MTVYATKYLRDTDEGEMYSQLFRCSDGNTYVVKVMSNPTGKRALFNELVSYRLGKLLNLPIARGRIIVFSKKKFNNPDLFDELGIEEGPHFGSLFIENAGRYSAVKLPFCKNIHLLPDIIVYDNWITNYDRRFERQNILMVGNNPYELVLIDHAHAFNGPDWTIESLIPWSYGTNVIWGDVYQEFVPFMDNKDPFGRALERLEALTEKEIAVAFGKDLPPEWEISKEEIKTLLFHLNMRKKRMRKIVSKLKHHFPIWSSSGK